MDLLPDEAQQEIVDATRAFLAEEMPLSRLREADAAAARPDAGQFVQMAEFGWFGLGLRESEGGVGCTLAEEALLLREVGRQAGSVQILATLLAAHVASVAGDTARRGDLLAGNLRVGWAEPIGAVDLAAAVSGSFQVYDGRGADLWISVGDGGAVLLRPAADARSLPCLDEFTTLQRSQCRDEDALARVGAGARLAERAAVLVAAMAVGVAEAARDQAAAYAAERVQFGRPIGVFQAIKHRCADMAVRCEAAWSQACYAALALRDALPDAAFQVSVAKHLAGEMASENAASNLQVHGGYGFTTEYGAHVLVKRAHVLNAIAGTSRWHLERLLRAPLAA